MSTIVLSDVELYAFCTDALCPGYVQEKVPGIHNRTTHTYGDAGAEDAFQGFPQRTNDYLQFADEHRDGTCVHCQGPRIVSDQERPDYGTQAQKAQERQDKGDSQDLSMTKLYLDERLKREEGEKLAKENANRTSALEEKLNALLEAQEVPKRGPGRPPKDAA